jgi:hypothetical protein
MKTPLKNFLTELYAIDPDLQEHEAELIPLLEKLLAEDPARSPDADFVATLRRQLQERAGQLEQGPRGSLWNNLLFGLGGAVAAAVIVPVALTMWNNKQNSSESPLFGYKIEETGNEAFGSLRDASQTGAPSARPQSGGGGGMGMGGGGGNVAMDAKMIAPYPMVEYTYTYDGDIKDLADSVPVFKRQSGKTQVPLSAIASRLNLGTVDVNSFNSMNIDSVSFTQSTPFGYSLYVNLRDSSVNIDANWEQWPQSKCTTEACYKNEQVKIGDIPADEN